MKHRTWQQGCHVSQLIPHRRVHKPDHLLFSTGSACLDFTRYVRERRDLDRIGVGYSHGLLARRWIGQGGEARRIGIPSNGMFRISLVRIAP